MSPKLIMFCVFIFVFGTFFSLIYSQQWYDDQEITVMEQMTGYSSQELETSAGSWTIVKVGMGFVSHGLPTVLSWNYPFLTESGLAGFLVQILLWVVTAGMLFGIFQLFLPLIQSVITAVGGLF